MIKKLTSLCVTIIILISPIQAAQGDALLLTDLGSSAKMIGIGNIEGFSSDAHSVFQNVASLYKVNQYSIAAFTTKLMDEAVYNNIALASRFDFGTLALGYMSVGVSDIPKTDKQNGRLVKTGSFIYDSSLLKLGYETSLTDKLYFGSSINYYTNSLDTVVGTGFNADMGLMYVRPNFECSFIAKNMIPQLKAQYTNNQEETYPFQTITSAGYSLNDFNFFAQFKTASHQKHPIKSFGVEYNPNMFEIISFYAGMKEYYALQSIKNTYTLGLGIDLFGVNFDYTYEKSDHISFDNHNYFSIGINIEQT